MQMKGAPSGATERELIDAVKQVMGCEPLVWYLHRVGGKGGAQWTDGTGMVKFNSAIEVNRLWRACGSEGIEVPGYKSRLQFDPTWMEFCVPNCNSRSEAKFPPRAPNQARYSRWDEFSGEALRDRWLYVPLKIDTSRFG